MKLPRLGQSVEEAQIVEWLKKEGETVQAGEPLLTVQTDKAEIEVEAPASGIVRKILMGPGADVPVLSVIAYIGSADEALPESGAVREGAQSAAAHEADVPAQAGAPAATEPARAYARPPGEAAEEVKISPRARKLSAEHHVDATHLLGSGAGGRIIEEDVRTYVGQLESARMTPTARRLAGMEGLDPQGLQGTGAGGRITKADLQAAKPAAAVPAGSVQRVPLTPMRRVIAKRMAESKFSAPHYYVTVEVDMAAAKAFRSGLSFKASFNDLVLRAVTQSLSEYPAVNARWAGDAIELVGDVNLGMAVALPTGLIVPVLHQAQRLSLEELSRAAKKLAEKAQNNKLLPDDYTGSTFTVSNLGPFGVDQFTAIINQPDSAILAVGQMKDRVVAIDGGIHIRPIMKLTLSSDHRVIDGAVTAQFMGRLKGRLEAAEF
ncbi:MAG: 2-oxo acid dehydrogenase subunit E2 [Candidatus Hydrogenedentes bacterium]|nr:2-oxo acid dehydrogenase subunit E2 [Candidatus Hydrogenedentota bacterium]